MVPLDLWAKNLHVLDEGAVKRLTRTLWPYRRPDELDEHECLQLSVADWLTHLGIVSDAQVVATVNAVRPQLARLAVELVECERSAAPSFSLVLCDGRWVSCTGREAFFDLEEFNEVGSLPEFAVTHIVCDVTALYFRSVKRLERLRKIQETREGARTDVGDLDTEMSRKEGRASTPRSIRDDGSESGSQGRGQGTTPG
jgi:hypothetical protein